MDVATKTELKDVPQQLDDATLASDDKKLASNDTSISSDLSASLQKNIKVLSRLFLYCPIIGLGLASFQVINPSHTCRAIIVQPNKVYIGGLPDDTRETDLRDCFGTFGPIKYIELKWAAASDYFSVSSLIRADSRHTEQVTALWCVLRQQNLPLKTDCRRSGIRCTSSGGGSCCSIQ